jgi:NSS family neurotransmitter:Na+ symporter
MENQDLSQRGAWGSKVTFVFAAAGSAIGLGNIWRFPMVVGQNGGALFVLVYILAVALIGFAVMLAELAIGRYSRKNPVGAFEFIKPGSLWKFIGYFGILTAVCILSYYAVIAGWSAGYLIKMTTGSFSTGLTSELSDAIFTEFSADPVQTILFFLMMIGITTLIVSKGIKGGIERWTRILMPILFILIVFLAVRALTLPGAREGISFYLKPDFSQLSGKLVLFALGQAFFSLSLGMGIMVTYGSYISKSDNLVTSAGWVCFFDSLIAFLAGVIIFPTLFAIPGIAPTAGPGLVFKVLPLIFSKIPGGILFGILFFCLFSIAALTSTISLLEVPVAYFVDERSWSRKKAAILVGLFVFCLGIPSALSSGGMAFFTKFNLMSNMDFIFNSVFLPIGALLVCLFLGYVWGVKNAAREILSGNPRFKLRPLWSFSVKFLSPIAILIILYFIKTIAE